MLSLSTECVCVCELDWGVWGIGGTVYLYVCIIDNAYVINYICLSEVILQYICFWTHMYTLPASLFVCM